MADSIFIVSYALWVADNHTKSVPIALYDASLYTGDVYAIRVPIREAGVFSNFFGYVSANNVAANTTVTLMKSGSATSLVLTWGSSQTGVKEDTNAAHNATFAATDYAHYRLAVPSVSGTNSVTFNAFGVQFTPTTTANCVTILGTTDAAGFATITVFYPTVSGKNDSPPTTETYAKWRALGAAIVSNLYVNVGGPNTRTAATVIGTRINGGAGNQSVSFAASETGIKEDITHTDSLAAGDDFNFYIDLTAGGSGSIAFSGPYAKCVNTSNQFFLTSAYHAGFAQAYNVTNYLGAAGYPATQASEAKVQVYPRFTFTAKMLSAMVSANTIATSATLVRLRAHGADGNASVSFAAAETGLKQDVSSTDTITSGVTEIDYSVVTPNTSGSITFTWIGCMGDTTTSLIGTWCGLARASIDAIDGLAIASVGSVDGLA